MAQFEKPFGSAVIHDSVCRLRCELDTYGLHVKSVMNRPNLIGNIFFDSHPVPNTQKLHDSCFLIAQFGARVYGSITSRA
jgi:hypothetical protein